MKMDFKQTGMDDEGWIHLTQARRTCGLFGFHKVREIYWLAQKRFTSQDSLCCRQLVSKQTNKTHKHKTFESLK
jgi:hypothetical protein